MGQGTKKVVVTENSRSFSVVTTDFASDSIHIDTSEFASLPSRCDFAVRVSSSMPKHFFFAELKGNDVIKAAKQLVCTIEKLTALYKAYAHREAWVISGGWRPAVMTSFQIQRAKALKFGFDLKHRTRTMTVDLTR